MVKNLPATAGDRSLNSGSERSPGGGHGANASVLAWRTPWSEETGAYSSQGGKLSERTEAT